MIKKVKKTLEKDIQNEICQYLKDNHFFFWRSNNIPVFGRNNGGKMVWRSLPKFCIKGVPDIIIIKEGMFIGIEVKREGAKQRNEQIYFETMCNINGGLYYLVHSVEETKVLLNRFILNKD